MATCSLSTLLDQACESGFRCLDEKTFRGVLLQLLCDFQASGGGGGASVWGGITGTLSNQTDLVAAIAAAQSAAVVASHQSFAGSGPPTTQVPANGAGNYWDYTNKFTYNWNPTLPGANKWE